MRIDAGLVARLEDLWVPGGGVAAAGGLGSKTGDRADGDPHREVRDQHRSEQQPERGSETGAAGHQAGPAPDSLLSPSSDAHPSRPGAASIGRRLARLVTGRNPDPQVQRQADSERAAADQRDAATRSKPESSIGRHSG